MYDLFSSQSFKKRQLLMHRGPRSPRTVKGNMEMGLMRILANAHTRVSAQAVSFLPSNQSPISISLIAVEAGLIICGLFEDPEVTIHCL